MAITIAIGSPRLLFFFCIISIHLLVLAIAQTNQLYHICSDSGNFTTSTYKSNLNHLLSSLSSDIKIDYGFYNGSYGQNPDQVSAISLCRGDKRPETCRSCIKNSSQELTSLCPNQKEAIIWYDDCMLRYSNRSIFGNMESGPYFFMYNLNNVSEVDQFNQVLKNLLDNLTSKAAMGDSLRKFATGNATTTNSQTIYALVQCTPDLPEQECSNCLTEAIKFIPQCCNGRQGGRVITPSCHFRYEKDIFYGPTAEALPPSSSPVPLPSQATPILPPSTQVTPISQPPISTATTTQGKASNIIRTVIAGVFVVLVLRFLSLSSAF